MSQSMPAKPVVQLQLKVVLDSRLQVPPLAQGLERQGLAATVVILAVVGVVGVLVVVVVVIVVLVVVLVVVVVGMALASANSSRPLMPMTMRPLPSVKVSNVTGACS